MARENCTGRGLWPWGRGSKLLALSTAMERRADARQLRGGSCGRPRRHLALRISSSPCAIIRQHQRPYSLTPGGRHASESVDGISDTPCEPGIRGQRPAAPPTSSSAARIRNSRRITVAMRSSRLPAFRTLALQLPALDQAGAGRLAARAGLRGAQGERPAPRRPKSVRFWMAIDELTTRMGRKRHTPEQIITALRVQRW